MKRALVIGAPVAQARSPLLHSFWLNEYGIEGSYDREEVQPENVAQFLRDLQARGFAGCNVTIPNKEPAFRACTRTTSRASALEAVNTIWFENGEIWGDNTDGLASSRISMPSIPAGKDEPPHSPSGSRWRCARPRHAAARTQAPASRLLEPLRRASWQTR